MVLGEMGKKVGGLKIAANDRKSVVHEGKLSVPKQVGWEWIGYLVPNKCQFRGKDQKEFGEDLGATTV